MFSNQYCFYNKPDQSHLLDGGPRSYFEFEYQGKRIILIGDRHRSLPIALGKQYQYIFNQAIDDNCKKNKNIKIFVEQQPNYVVKETDKLDLINILSGLKTNDNTQIIFSDDRIVNKGLVDLMLFLENVREFERQFRIKLISQGIQVSEVITFPEYNDGIEKELKKIASCYKNKISFNHFQKFFEAHLKRLDDLLKVYKDKDKNLEKYITECSSELFVGYDNFLQFKNHCSAFYNKKDVGDKYLDEVCIKMMIGQGSFQLIDFLKRILSYYSMPSIDAALACKLWDEIHNENAQILIVGFGAAHIEVLAEFLPAFCKPIYKVVKKDDAESIPPHEIQAYLNREFKEPKEESYYQCRMM